jgi:hypothetical protein
VLLADCCIVIETSTMTMVDDMVVVVCYQLIVA